MNEPRVFSGFRLVDGHRVGLRVIVFPHRCPGPGCAIARWIGDRALRNDLAAADDGQASHIREETA